jgi:Lrp/AsnC family transcriptional regulator, regulator for asnA, asnC and gidA
MYHPLRNTFNHNVNSTYAVKNTLTQYAKYVIISKSRRVFTLMDETDLKIAFLLGGNARISNREIARRIGVAEGTVRQRLTSLMEHGILHLSAQFDIEKIPEAYIALVGLKIDGRMLRECAEEINRLPSVLNTMIVTGRYDLIATVMALSHHTLVEFVTDQLSRISGIEDSETYVVLRNYGQWVPSDQLSLMMRTSIESELLITDPSHTIQMIDSKED